MDLWPAVAQKFEEKTGYRVELVDTGTVEVIAATFAAGELGLARFVDLWGTGKREVAQDLWTKAGIYPVNKTWFVKDNSDSENRQLVYTASLGNAYCLFGRVPVVGKKVNTGGLQIMVEGDLAMQRPFVVMEANPKRFPRANDVGARKLSSFLLSREIQELLPQYKG